MINQDIAICLICYKTDNCDDNPLAVLISREGLTEKVFRNVRNTRDLFNMDNKYNGIPYYEITISEKEYKRFERLVYD